MFFNMGGGRLGIFPIPKAYIEGGETSTTMNLRVGCTRLEAYCCKFSGRVWSVYGGEMRVTPRTSFRSVLCQLAVVKGG